MTDKTLFVPHPAGKPVEIVFRSLDDQRDIDNVLSLPIAAAHIDEPQGGTMLASSGKLDVEPGGGAVAGAVTPAALLAQPVALGHTASKILASTLVAVLLVLCIAAMSTAGSQTVLLEAPDFPYSYYLLAIQNKITERWQGRALDGRQPVATFQIDRNGRISDLVIAKTSGEPDYDQAALRTIKESAPFPPIPQDFPSRFVRVRVRFVSEEQVAEETKAREEREAQRAHRAQREQVEREAKKRAEREAREQAAEALRVAKARASGWPSDVIEAVLHRRILIGMTRDQVRAAWGAPVREAEATTAQGTTTWWLYPNGRVHFSGVTVDRVETWRHGGSDSPAR